MIDLVRPYVAGFENANFIVGLQLSGLSNEDAIRRARGDEGASISWIVGHLLSYRCGAVRALGLAQEDPYTERFSVMTPASDGRDYPDIADLHQQWNEIHDALNGALQVVQEPALHATSSAPGPGGEQTVMDDLSFRLWHEAYHLGAIGMLRVQWGQRHTHEMAMEAYGLTMPDPPAA